MKILLWILCIFFLCSCGMGLVNYDDGFVLTEEYLPFQGDFRGDFVGGTVTATFIDNKVFSSCETVNTVVYFEYSYVINNETITTYTGEEGIIWWFQCNKDSYTWIDKDTLQIIDSKYADQILILQRT